MVKRIVTAVVAALFLLLPCLIWSDTWLLPIGVSVFAAIGAFELIRCTKVHHKLWLTIPLCLMAGAAPICVRLGTDYNDEKIMIYGAMAAVLLFVVYMLMMTVFVYGRVSVPDVCTALVLSLYATVGFASIVYLRDLKNAAGEDIGVKLFLLPFIGAWITDIFAYFTGILFGKHKLIPHVSPKKTVEGSIGGAVFCIAAFVLYSVLFFGEGAEWTQHLFFGIIGLVASFVAQIGDLSVSVLKRHYDRKDMGRILPGHGGVMDRFDSIVAVAAVLAVSFSLLF